IQALWKSTVDLRVDNGLDLGSLSAVTLGGLSGTGALNLGATELTVGTNGTNGASTTFAGALGGNTGMLVKRGTGTLTLTRGGTLGGATCIGGALVVSGGTLTLTAPRFGSPALAVGTPDLTGVVRVENGGRLALGPGTSSNLDGPAGTGLTVTG